MTSPTTWTATHLAGWSWRRLGRSIALLPGRYPVAIAVVVVPALATAGARWALGDAPTPAEIDRLGYGWPNLEDGRLWSLLSGAFLVHSLTISLLPSFSFLGVVLLEHKAGHWRASWNAGGLGGIFGWGRGPS